MKPTFISCSFSLLALCLTPLSRAGDPPAPGAASSTPPPAKADATIFPIPKLTGSIWERERLLGDLGGSRQSLAEHGVQFDFNLVQVYQGVFDGGETDRWATSVGTTAVRTLLGGILDRAQVRAAQARQQLAPQVEALVQARLAALGGKALARFEALPRAEQVLIRRRLAQVPDGTWQNLRNEVRDTLQSKLASGRETLDAVLRDRIANLNLGSFGNTGDREEDYFGLWSFETKLDTAKMGLWPGGFFFMRVQGQYGDSVNARSGALLPPNIDSTFPSPGLDDVVIPHIYFTQFLSEHVAVLAGKLDITGGDMNEFAHLQGDEKFVGSAFGANPALAMLAPYSPLGAGFLILPTKDWVISLFAIDGDGVPTRSGFDTVWEGKTSYIAETRLTTHFFGKTGHQLVGGAYGSGGYMEFKQDLRAFIPNSGVTLNESDDTWAVYYNFDQYLWNPTVPSSDPKEGPKVDPTRGVGIFGRIGFADERTNPIAQFYSAGIGGKGLGSARPHDRWGLGWYYMKTSDDLPSFLELGDEQGFEAFYNLAVTPAFMITADLQVTDSARKQVDTAVIGGLRATMRF